MNPIKFCVRFKPPRLCLIYELNHEEFFHEFLLSPEDLEVPTKKLVKTMKEIHQGYLDQIDSEQIHGLIERIKLESKKKTEILAPVNNKNQNPANSRNPNPHNCVPPNVNSKQPNPVNSKQPNPVNSKQLDPVQKPEVKKNPGAANPGGKVSSVDKFRTLLGNLGITESDKSSSDEGHVDFNAVEKSFQNESDSDY